MTMNTSHKHIAEKDFSGNLFPWFGLIFFFSVLFSCKPESLELELPVEPSKPVLSAQYTRFEGAGVLAMVLSNSFNPVSEPIRIDSLGLELDSSLLASGAQVWIEGPGVAQYLPELDPGIYGSETINLQDGKQYQVSVSVGNHRLQATTTKMQKVEMDSFAVLPDAGRKNLSVFIRFQDIPNQKNYYVINYTGSKKEPLPQDPDPDYIARRILEQNAGFDLLTDEGADGKMQVFSKNMPIPSASDTFALAITHISKGYYEFLSAQKKSGTLFNQLRAEVINFPGNVKGGYGYFELNEPDLKVIQLR